MPQHRQLGNLTWATDGIQFCFDSNETFYAVDSQKGIERYSLATGRGKVVWNSDKNEELCVLQRTGANTFFSGGSAGFGYELEVTASGEWKLRRERELARYFGDVTFFKKQNILAVLANGRLRLVSLDSETPAQVVCEAFMYEYIHAFSPIEERDEVFVLSSRGLYIVGLSGDVKRIPAPHGRFIAALNVENTGQFLGVVGKGQEVTLFLGSYDAPEEIIWSTTFRERARIVKGYEEDTLTNDAGLSIAWSRKEIVLACGASVRFVDLEGGNVRKRIPLPYRAIGVTLSPDEEHAAIGTWLAGSFVLNSNGEFVCRRTSHAADVQQFLFSADESRVFSRALGSPEVLCWRTADAVQLWNFGSAGDSITELIDEDTGNLLIARDGFEVEGAVIAELDATGNERIQFPLHGFDARAIKTAPAQLVVVLKGFGKPSRLEVRELPKGRVVSTTQLKDFAAEHIAHKGSVCCIHDGFHLWICDLANPGKLTELAPPTEDDDIAIWIENESSIIVISRTGIFRSSMKSSQWKKVISFDISATAAGRVVDGIIPIAFENGRVELRRVSDWSVARTESVAFGASTISACTLSPSGQFLAVGASDGQMMLCDFS